MTTDRELMQQALSALTQASPSGWSMDSTKRHYDTIEALRARLANEFNPDWDTMAVMVEEQQRMAKRIEELEAVLAQPEQEPVAWRNAAIRIGEELSSVGPDGYYNMTAEKWLDWAMEQEPRGKSLLYTTPPQREWVGLTDEEIQWCYEEGNLLRAIEAKLKEKNEKL